MKRIIFVMCALLSVIAITGCTAKDEAPAQAPASQVSTPEVSVKRETVKQTVSAVVLDSGWALYEVNPDDGKLRAVAEVTKGDSISVVVNGMGEYETASMTRVLSNKKEDTINVVSAIYDNKPYYARSIYVSDYGAVEAAVILSDTQEYSKADILGITERKLTAGTFVAIYADSTEEFCHARIYNGNDYGREIYIPKDCVGYGVKTVEVAKTLSRFTKDTKVEVVDSVLTLMLDQWNAFTAGSYLDGPTEAYLASKVLDKNRSFNVSDEIIERIIGMIE